jgi:hypothetical protein
MNTLINDISILEKYKKIISLKDIPHESKNFYFDTKDLYENISNVLPNFISYRISANNELLIENAYDEIESCIFLDIKLSERQSLQLYLGVNKNSDFYKTKVSIVIKIILIYFIFSTLLLLTVFFLIYKMKKSNEKNIKYLEERIEKNISLHKNLLNQKKILSKLHFLFSKKATEIYIKAESKSLHKIPSNKYIFPMILFDCSNDVINIKALIKDLEEYFSLMFENILLNVNTSVENISLKCSMEAFYQIIFSLIFNIINFMYDQSNSIKKLNIKFNKKMISIEYDSFCLDTETLVRLSENLIMKKVDIFFLSFEKIFKSLEDHNFKYEINSNKNLRINTFNITYPVIINNPNKKECNIIDITKYKNENINKINNK